MSDRLAVTVLENGPLKISNARGLTYCGEPLQVEGDLYLCRCGESKNAPYCDGSHNAAGFDGSGTDRAPKDVRVWEGQTVRTYFNPNVCMHVFYCKPLNDLRAAELAGDASAATEIIRVVESCPSGALTYEVKTECPLPEDTEQVDVEVMEGGEVRIQCAYDINADRGERQPDDRATLCRCGLSRNKPWCDGRHKAKADFK
jgi:CDGSH-type Zn-finger protein